jgi:hypothetical protein
MTDPSAKHFNTSLEELTDDCFVMAQLCTIKNRLRAFESMGLEGHKLAHIAHSGIRQNLKLSVEDHRDPKDLSTIAQDHMSTVNKMKERYFSTLVLLGQMRLELGRKTKDLMRKSSNQMEYFERGGLVSDLVQVIGDHGFFKELTVDGEVFPEKMQDLPLLFDAGIRAISSSYETAILTNAAWIKAHRRSLRNSMIDINELKVPQTLQNTHVKLPGGWEWNAVLSDVCGEDAMEAMSRFTGNSIRAKKPMREQNVPKMEVLYCKEGIEQTRSLTLLSTEVFDKFFKDLWKQSQIDELVSDCFSQSDDHRSWLMFNLALMQINLIMRAATGHTQIVYEFCEAYLDYIDILIGKEIR